MLDGLTTILEIFAAVTLLFFEKFCRWYLADARLCDLTLVGFYLIWLVYNVWTIVDESAEVAVAIHLWSVLTQIHQAVVAQIYSSLCS
jgi:hypothetical protein